MKSIIPTYADLPIIHRILAGGSHCVSVIVGVPSLIITGSSVMFLICPVISYLVCRKYRKISSHWLSSQAFQGTIVNLILGLTIFMALEFNLPNGITLLMLTASFITALYTLWGALDVILGFDFNYILIGKVSKKVSLINQSRKKFEDPYLPTKK